MTTVLKYTLENFDVISMVHKNIEVEYYKDHLTAKKNQTNT